MEFKIREWNEISMDVRPRVRYWLPGAAVDEKDLREDLRQIAARGFGGVEVVAFLITNPEIIHGEDGWGTENWKRVLAVISDETAKLGMSMDIANGPAWPISMPTIHSADDPAALQELTFGAVELPGNTEYYRGPLPERETVRAEGKPYIEAILSYRKNKEGKLISDSYQPLCEELWGSPAEETKEICVTFLETADRQTIEPESTLVLYAFYRQPAAQRIGDGMYYVVDHFGRAGVKACEAYWDTVFTEADKLPNMGSFVCDSLEYNVSMEWNREFAAEFERRRGYSVIPYLPVIGAVGTYPPTQIAGMDFDRPDLKNQINQDYFETVTDCYCENHLAALEGMAQKYGKDIRYQVAYNKPLEEERSAYYVGVPENEALGRPFLDGMKLMGAAAHLGRKKRYSFECSAEFGNAYGQDYEDLFWWVKRGLISGMNAQVMHGASYAGGYHGKYSVEGSYAGTQWPGYAAFGPLVSNNWNQTLSLPDARGCMDTISRMNALFRKTKKLDCAIYRSEYYNFGWYSEYGLYEDEGALLNKGYSYETISPFLLGLPVCRVASDPLLGRLVLDAEGPAYQALIIPEQESISRAGLEQILRLLELGLPVIWIGSKPQKAQYYSDIRSDDRMASWADLLNRVWNAKSMIHADTTGDVPGLLALKGVLPRAAVTSVLSAGESHMTQMDLATAVHRDTDNACTYYGLYGYNRVKFDANYINPKEMSCAEHYVEGTIKKTYVRPGEKSRRLVSLSLAGEGEVFRLDPWTGTTEPLDFKKEDGRMAGSVVIEEDELLLLAVKHGANEKEQGNSGLQRSAYFPQLQPYACIPVCFHSLTLQEFGPKTSASKSFLDSSWKEEGHTYPITGPVSWVTLDSTKEKWAGRGRYKGSITLDGMIPDGKYILNLGDVNDTFRVWINGQETAFPDQVLKKVDITDLLIPGKNELEVLVTSNLYNRIICGYSNPYLPFQIPYFRKEYGIMETPDKLVRVEVYISDTIG